MKLKEKSDDLNLKNRKKNFKYYKELETFSSIMKAISKNKGKFPPIYYVNKVKCEKEDHYKGLLDYYDNELVHHSSLYEYYKDVIYYFILDITILEDIKFRFKEGEKILL
jgi:hypothetical protein